MIRRYTFILCSLFLSTVSAQSWCAPGAEWTYRFSHYPGEGMSVEGIVHVKYVGDTLIGGHGTQRLAQWSRTQAEGSSEIEHSDLGQLYTRFADDVVYLWDEVDHSFDTLFWYGAQVTDHWWVAGWPDSRFWVDSTATIIVDGEELRQLIVTIDSPDIWPLQDTITERVGTHFSYLAPGLSGNPLAGMIRFLRCYRDNEIFFHPGDVLDCGFFVNIDEKDLPKHLVHPNPGTDHFSLHLPPGEYELKIFDQLGRSVMQIERISDRSVIGMASFPPGIYTLQITDLSEHLFHQRWIKE